MFSSTNREATALEMCEVYVTSSCGSGWSPGDCARSVEAISLSRPVAKITRCPEKLRERLAPTLLRADERHVIGGDIEYACERIRNLQILGESKDTSLIVCARGER